MNKSDHYYLHQIFKSQNWTNHRYKDMLPTHKANIKIFLFIRKLY